MILSNIWSRKELNIWIQISKEIELSGIKIPDAAKRIVERRDASLLICKNTASKKTPIYRVPGVCRKHKEVQLQQRPCGKGFFCPACWDDINTGGL